jgi:hypothetical protein
MFRRVAQVGFSMAAGAAAETMNRKMNPRVGEAGPSSSSTKPGTGSAPGFSQVSTFERGDAKLSRLADSVKPQPTASPVREGLESFFTSRKDAVSSVANVGGAVASGKVGLKDLAHSVEEVKENVVFTTKVAQVAGHGELGAGDAARVAGAGVKHAGEKALTALTQANPLEAVRGAARATQAGAAGAYASATVSDSGVGALKHAVDERAKHETQKVATSAALSAGAGVVAGMIHPGLGLAARALGGLAVGHQVSEAASKIHGRGETGEVGAMRAEFRKIVEEKAGPSVSASKP